VPLAFDIGTIEVSGAGRGGDERAAELDVQTVATSQAPTAIPVRSPAASSLAAWTFDASNATSPAPRSVSERANSNRTVRDSTGPMDQDTTGAVRPIGRRLRGPDQS